MRKVGHAVSIHLFFWKDRVRVSCNSYFVWEIVNSSVLHWDPEHSWGRFIVLRFSEVMVIESLSGMRL